MELKEQIIKEKLPRHIAIIMDGNGRWAKQRGHQRLFGHQHAITAVRDSVEACAELGVEYLTLYAFSIENWNRPALEVSGLMTLFAKTMNDEMLSLKKNGVRLNAIGDLKSLPETNYRQLLQVIDDTKDCTGLTLNIALSYSGRWDLTEAARKMATEVAAGHLDANKITQDTLNTYLSTAGMPDPELMIRTSGEERISNFLLWQLAYSELYFTPVLWPDFRKKDLYEAIIDYQHRERRFGKTSEQIDPK